MSAPNSNLQPPFSYPSNQNTYSPVSEGTVNRPCPGQNAMIGPPYAQQQPGNQVISPVNASQPLSQSSVAPQVAQNYNYTHNSSQVPFSTPPSKSTTNLGAHIPVNPLHSASPKNPVSPYGVEKQYYSVQNGPLSPQNSNYGASMNGGDSSQINGVNVANQVGPNQNVSTAAPWQAASSLMPPSQNQMLPTSSSGIVSSPPHQFSSPSPQPLTADGKPVPTLSQVPSPGLPLPYGTQNNSFSPQVTPGTSRPSNSSMNLQNMGLNPNPGLCPPNYRSSDSGPPVSSNMSTVYSGTNMSPNSSPASSQSGAGMAPSQTGPVRPRYPQQVGYNQMPSQYTSPVVNQPGVMQPPPNSRFNKSPRSPYQQQQQQQQQYQHQPPQQQSPYQSGMPEGPVGGVSGYDPQLHAKMAGMSVTGSFSRLWGNDNINLLQDRNILPAMPLEAPKPVLAPERPNCSPEVFRCTLTKVPDTSSLLQKSRLPFGVLIHPFRDNDVLPVIQCNTIVRCRNCRTYINPFVSFIDQRRWKCNLCFRVNDLPEEFLYDPTTRAYGDPSRRPEIRNATIEFIAPSDYMLRPPQPAVYLFILDVSHVAVETGYLHTFCKILLDSIDELPGDSRTRVGFMTFDGSIHFYNLGEGLNQPHMLVVSDIEDVFLPSPDNLLVNLHESRALISDLLTDLPKRFENNGDINNCLGAALQAAYKLMSPVGGRITVVQACLPSFGPGALKNREDPNLRAAKDVSNIGPANDFYKKLALDCSGQQIAVDLFMLCSQYVDIATISCIAKYSSGNIHYYPGYHHQLGQIQVEKFAGDLKRYLTRNIGFEAVMRIRCTRGLTIHTFHGNFFVRSTDLLSLPNVNPDTGYGMQIAIEENLSEYNSVCFQAAVLYTSSNGERRIRVHTLCLPVVSILQDVLGGADQETIIGLVAKMAVDRSVSSSLTDARDALINVCLDVLGVYKVTMAGQVAGALMSPYSTRLLPLFILALLKHVAFRTGVSTKLDERVFAMDRMKSLPLIYLMKYIYPTLYPVHALDEKNAIHQDDDAIIPQPVILQLSSEKIDRHGAYILDTFDVLYLYIGKAINDHFCTNVLNVPNFSAIPENLNSLPELPTPESERLRSFVSWLRDQRPFHSPLKIIREDSRDRHIFVQYMIDDRTESLFSYYEFLQHIRQQISK
ncbi:protein transport protein Sec24A-like isoform X2 [Uloborus diversus]|uniref:protein transport protein Sec24A-like isoform X2 n=1 Tax=Uloborus diversus TaxID=327109 RepID=UPI00240A672C|nr:protein transport protein Sec24A-like isoform X2 [Uloborus diversus]